MSRRLLLLRLVDRSDAVAARTGRQQVRGERSCSATHTQPSWPVTSLNAGSVANNSVLRPSGLPPVSDRNMVDADVDRSSRRLQPSAGRPASSAVVAVPAPAAVAAAGAMMCSVDRRLVRRELLTWAKKIPVVVGTSY